MLIGIDCHHIIDQKGIERYLLNLLGFWKDEKDVKFILYLRDKASLAKIPQSKNFTPKILKSLFGFSSTAFFQHVLLSIQAKKDKVDLLFSPSYFLPIFYQGKTVVTIHDIIYQVHPEWFNFRLGDKILVKLVGRKSAQKADLIFTPSEFSKQEIIKFYGIRPEKIKVTLLASDEIFKQVDDRKPLEAIKEKYRIKKNYFLFIAVIFERRCVQESILAFETIAKKYSDFQYLIIGKDLTSERNIEILAQEINQKLSRQAIIYSQNFISSEEMLALYNGAHATIYLSVYEGFGLPLLESASCGTPVICGNAEVFREVLGDDCFWVDNPQDIKQIEKIMERTIEDKKFYDDIKFRAQEKVKEFSWKKCAINTLQVFKQISTD